MRTFDDEVGQLARMGAEMRGEIRKRTQELFRDFYPRLSDEEIERELRSHGYFDDLDVRVIQAFYRTASYHRTLERPGMCTGLGGVRMRVLRALRDLPEESQLHVALTMSYDHRSLYDEETP